MSVVPGALVTPAGAAAFASSEAGAPVVLAYMAFGDANGIAYQPTGQETALVHELVRVPLDQVVRDPANANQLIATATLPTGVGGFTVREVAIFTAAGALAAIMPDEFYKSGPGDSVVTDLTQDVFLAVSSAAAVTVALNDAALVTEDWVFLHRQFFAVKSATTAAAPAAPAAEDQYLLPAAPTGAWAGHGNQVAIWRNPADGWLFIAPPAGAQANAADTGVSWRLTPAGAWIQAGSFGAEATVASAATVDIGAAGSHLINVTGGARITSLGASADLNAPLYGLRFTGGATLAAGAGLMLPGNADIATAAGDYAFVQYLGAGNARVVTFQPAAGYDRAGAAAAAQAAANQHTDAVAALLAALLSPVFQGTPQAPTAAVGTNTTQLATCAFVQAAFVAFTGGAPSVLATWLELVAAIQNDESGLASLTAQMATKAATADVQTWDANTLAAAKAYADMRDAQVLSQANATAAAGDAGKVNRAGDSMQALAVTSLTSTGVNTPPPTAP